MSLAATEPPRIVVCGEAGGHVWGRVASMALVPAEKTARSLPEDAMIRDVQAAAAIVQEVTGQARPILANLTNFPA